jgi:hypothetical protein
VEFDTIAREWRMKWAPDNDRAALTALQDLLSSHLEQIKQIGQRQSILHALFALSMRYSDPVMSPSPFVSTALCFLVSRGSPLLVVVRSSSSDRRLSCMCI